MHDSVLRDTVPPVLSSRKLLPVASVAPIFQLSPEYFVKCIKAYPNEEYRRKQKISKSTLDSLPLRHWFKRGRGWFIEEPSFLAQL